MQPLTDFFCSHINKEEMVTLRIILSGKGGGKQGKFKKINSAQENTDTIFIKFS